MRSFLLTVLMMTGFPVLMFSQVVADFILPDTICINAQVKITNLTTGGSTFYWSFCSGSTSLNPVGTEMKNTSGVISGPAYITVVQDGDECYSFVTNQWNKSVTRFYHGNTFGNDPLSSKTFYAPGIISDSVQGIQVKKDNGQWYGIIVDDALVIRMDFGNSLSNDPVFVMEGPFPTLYSLHGLVVLQQDAQHWFGITSSSLGSKIYRLDFGNSLKNTPVVTNITNGSKFNHPGPLSLVQENGEYYCFVVNSWGSTLSRGDFSTSLGNAPSWTDLGVVCKTSAFGIMLVHDCDQTNGFMSRYIYSSKPDLLFRLLLPGGITGPVSTQSLGNIGNLDRPLQFSEITRVRDTVYTFVPNQPTATISRLSFVTCLNSSIPSSNLYDPPLYTYDSVGTYNVRLTVNEGLPDQQNACKHIVVVNPAPVHLGPDRIICQGQNGFLDAGPHCDTVIWSTGDTTRRIRISQPGQYWVKAFKYGCWGSDTVNLNVYPYIPSSIKPDTAICLGQKYILNPGSYFKSVTWSTGDTTPTLTVGTAGTYWVTTVDTNNCVTHDTVKISLKPAIPVNLAHDTSICGKASIVLRVNVPGAAYQWQNGSKDSAITVTGPGIYWVRVSRDSCAVQDTSVVHDCANVIYFPTAFSPNNDGLNDYFRPLGPALSKFSLVIFNRWGQQVFITDNQETGWDGTSRGRLCEPDVYSWFATYELVIDPGSTKKASGTVVLLK